jgi:hypothetical protein
MSLSMVRMKIASSQISTVWLTLVSPRRGVRSRLRGTRHP